MPDGGPARADDGGGRIFPTRNPRRGRSAFRRGCCPRRPWRPACCSRVPSATRSSGTTRSTCSTIPHLNPPTWAGLRTLWAAPFEDLYSPVVYTVWAALAVLARGADGVLSPWPFHALCLALHAMNTLLVFLLARRLLADPRAAAVGAALFALHPLQVEPVVWVSGLKDVLCGSFCLGALLALARADQEATRGRRAWFAGATALYVLALLTKPAAVALPVVALGLERLALRRPRAQVLTTFAIWGLLALPMAWVTGRSQPIAAEGFESPLLGRPVVALDAIGFYLGKLVCPRR